jgi:hypothetical protein
MGGCPALEETKGEGMALCVQKISLLSLLPTDPKDQDMEALVVMTSPKKGWLGGRQSRKIVCQPKITGLGIDERRKGLAV